MYLFPHGGMDRSAASFNMDDDSQEERQRRHVIGLSLRTAHMKYSSRPCVFFLSKESQSIRDDEKQVA